MNMSGKDIFFSLAIIGLLFNAGLGLAFDKDEAISVNVVNVERMLKRAKLEFRSLDASPETVQLNTGLFLSFVQSTMSDIGSLDSNTLLLDSGSVYSGPVVDITDFVYARAMEQAQDNLGSDGVLKVGRLSER